MAESPVPDAAESGWAFHRKAHELNAIGRHDLALEQAQRGLAIDPDLAFLHVEQACALEGLERIDEAVDAARRAVSLDPDGVTGALSVLGFLQMRRGDNCDAEQSFLADLRLDPEHVPAWFGYAALMFRTMRFEKARRLLLHALSLDPEHADALRLLSAVELQVDGGRARGSAHRSLRAEPDSAAGIAALARVELVRGRPFRARRHFRDALRLDPSDEREQQWLEADRFCRWTMQPVYWLGVLAQRLPGGGVTVWAILMACMLLPPALGLRGPVLSAVRVAIPLVLLYTWVAAPLTRWWIRIRPPR